MKPKIGDLVKVELFGIGIVEEIHSLMDSIKVRWQLPWRTPGGVWIDFSWLKQDRCEILSIKQ